MLNIQEIHQQHLSQRGVCPECGSEITVHDGASGEVTCDTCGLILHTERLDHRPEWRAFTPAEKRAKIRVGVPISIAKSDKGLATTFQPYKDAQGHVLPFKKRQQMWRLRRWHLRAQRHSSTQRNLNQAMTTLMRLAETLHAPHTVRDSAAFIYRKALRRDLVKGRSINSIAAAALYAACRLSSTPRSLQQVADISTRSRKEISRNYRLLLRELNLQMPVDSPNKYVAKIASNVGLDQQIQNHALTLLQRAQEQHVDIGKAPQGVAAAALYIASIMQGQKTTQKALATAAGVTEVTVRNRYHGLDRDLQLGVRKILRG
jgi:transcription initiation factor TFIIB